MGRSVCGNHGILRILSNFLQFSNMSYYIIGKYINARLSVNYTERMETAKAGPGPTFALTLEDVRCPPVSQH